MAETQVSGNSEINHQVKTPAWWRLPDEARQDNYSYGYKGFRIHGYARLGPKSLRKLLFPELVKGEIDRKVAAEDFGFIPPSYVESQLLHYGIDFDCNMDIFQLKALLLTQVANGKCDAVPTKVRVIKARLADEFKATEDRFDAENQSYDAQNEAQNDLRCRQAFENCATPSEEVKCNKFMFLRKYFLDGDRNPDRSKTSRVIHLPNCILEYRSLRDSVERIPGLHVTETCFGNGTKGLVIGWNRANVIKEATKIDKEHNGGRWYSSSTRDWDRIMAKHDDYIKNHSYGGSFSAEYTAGNYVMRCSDIEFAWPKLSRELEIRIIHNGLMNSGQLAVFDLGIIFGMMILRTTPKGVSRAVANDRWDKIYSDSYDESDSDDETRDGTNAGSGKDTAMDEKPSTDGEDNESRYAVPVHSLKRRRIDDPPRRRCYFQWRGYNTMSGAIQLDPNNRNKGYLQFKDDDATKFDGKIFMGLVGGEVKFQGYRMPGFCDDTNLNWDALSHLASDREKV